MYNPWKETDDSKLSLEDLVQLGFSGEVARKLQDLKQQDDYFFNQEFDFKPSIDLEIEWYLGGYYG